MSNEDEEPLVGVSRDDKILKKYYNPNNICRGLPTAWSISFVVQNFITITFLIALISLAFTVYNEINVTSIFIVGGLTLVVVIFGSLIILLPLIACLYTLPEISKKYFKNGRAEGIVFDYGRLFKLYGVLNCITIPIFSLILFFLFIYPLYELSSLNLLGFSNITPSSHLYTINISMIVLMYCIGLLLFFNFLSFVLFYYIVLRDWRYDSIFVTLMYSLFCACYCNIFKYCYHQKGWKAFKIYMKNNYVVVKRSPKLLYEMVTQGAQRALSGKDREVDKLIEKVKWPELETL